MIGYFGDIIFETSSKKIQTFVGLKRTASARYADHNRYGKKPEREFTGPNNQTLSFEMRLRASFGVNPYKSMQKIIKYAESSKVCTFVIGGHKVGGGRWTIDNVDADYKEIWNHGELVAVVLSVTATEYQ